MSNHGLNLPSDSPLMTRPWGDLARHFRTAPWPSSQAIAGLCDYIDGRPLRASMHGWQSMLDLHIVQTPVTYPYDGPVLKVWSPGEATVEFRMLDTYVLNRQWNRQEPPERVIDRFKQTMRQLNWLTDVSVLD